MYARNVFCFFDAEAMDYFTQAVLSKRLSLVTVMQLDLKACEDRHLINACMLRMPGLKEIRITRERIFMCNEPITIWTKSGDRWGHM